MSLRKSLVAALAMTVALIGAAAYAAATQYMAICTEVREHGGQESALTPWVYGFEGANRAGKDHEVATRGHRWRIAERQVQ